MGTVTKNRQKAASLMDSRNLNHLDFIILLLLVTSRGKTAHLKRIKEEIIDMCPLEEIEQETVEVEEISETL